MRITELRAENIKRLQAVYIKPDGDVVVIGGANGQGKTSVLDSIEMALAGKSAVPSEPIRRGEDAARIVIETDDLVVTRKFTSGGSYLDVRNREGLKHQSPQAVLDKLTTTLSFDPLQFMRLKSGQQADRLREIAGVDVADLDRQYAETYERRRDQSRILKQDQAALKFMPEHDIDSESEVSVSDLVSRRDEMVARNAAVDELERRVTESEGRVARLREQLCEAEAEVAAATERLAASGTGRHDLGEITKQIATAEETNRKIRENQSRLKQSEAVAAAEEDVESLTAELKDIESRKAGMLASATLPLDGLEISVDNHPVYNGVPLDQASAAEQLRVSVAIAAALNPTLRVMLIRDGSLLDDDSMGILAEMASDLDLQVWIERVGDGDEGAVLIHDGEVAVAAAT